MKRIAFKKIVKEKLQIVAARYLIQQKLKHSKSQNLTYSKEMKPYLENESLKIEDKRLMFKIRNRLIDVKANYRTKFKEDMSCRLCKADEESQPHLFSCLEILSDRTVKDAIEGYTYNDIFSDDLKMQEQMINIWKKILKVRTHKMRTQSQSINEDSSSQASPFFGASYTSDSVRHWI